jgi:hypothetical protein
MKSDGQKLKDAVDSGWLSIGADLEKFVVIRNFHCASPKKLLSKKIGISFLLD